MGEAPYGLVLGGLVGSVSVYKGGPDVVTGGWEAVSGTAVYYKDSAWSEFYYSKSSQTAGGTGSVVGGALYACDESKGGAG